MKRRKFLSYCVAAGMTIGLSELVDQCNLFDFFLDFRECIPDNASYAGTLDYLNSKRK